MNPGTQGFPQRPRERVLDAVYATSVSLNVVADIALAIPPMPGLRYWPWQLMVRNSGIVASLTSAQFGLFTAPQGGGVALIASGTALSGITSNSENTAANFANFAGPTLILRRASVPVVYFRVTQVQAAGAAADIGLFLRPMP